MAALFKLRKSAYKHLLRCRMFAYKLPPTVVRQYIRCHYLLRALSYRIRRVRESLANLAYWLPILWADRDWDHSYLLRLMRHKISRMRRHQELYSHATDRHVRKLTHRMRTCELLLERLEKDDYYNYHAVPSCTWNERQREPTPHEVRLFKLESEKSSNRRKLDEELLFKLLRKHYRDWWD